MFAAKNELFTTPSGYQIQRSLRFRSSASAYLNRTPGSSGNRQKFTLSVWVKRGSLSGTQNLINVHSSTSGADGIRLDADKLNFYCTDTTNANLSTTAVFRDPSAWYHIVFAVDTTQATSTNRVRIYVNGIEQTSFSTSNYPAQNFNTSFNEISRATSIGRNQPYANEYFDGYLADINWIDGQQLTPSSFGAINATTGVWSATKYAGTYGTNGFYLPFTDNSAATATTIGKDYSGNGNNWTPNNISVTAGATYDSMLDAPLGAGGGERGNYCVMNPLDKGANSVAASGNLDISSNNGARQGIKGSFGVSTGKWYFEYTKTTAASASVGVASAATGFTADSNVGDSATSWGYLTTGNKLNNNTSTAYGATWTSNDVIGVALDMDAGTITFYKNNSSQGQAFSGLAGTVFPMGYNGSATADIFNFGQRPFSYTPPTGFKALHTGNLGAPVIALPAQNMAATTYTGNGTTQSIVNTVNGVSFQPNLAWVKSRNTLEAQIWIDSVRGVGQELESNSSNAEAYNANSIQSFNSNGYTSGNSNTNVATRTYVAWQWKAGGTAVSNTAGSITSSVSANASAGFSVVTYTGNEVAGATVGHGLGATPSMIIVKRRDGASVDWAVYHASIGATKYLTLNTTAAEGTSSGYWNNTAPTSSVFSLYNSGSTNANPRLFVAYCFAPVAGYSAFGSYTGNGSADGPFVFLGFRPRFVMIKSAGTANGWAIIDTARNTINVSGTILEPNSSSAEATYTQWQIDILSNGFKVRSGAYNESNGNGTTYIYMAFAENPFKNSLAR